MTDKSHFFGQPDLVILTCSFHEQDVGGVVIENIAGGEVSIVAVKIVTEHIVIFFQLKGVRINAHADIKDHDIDPAAAIKVIVAVLTLKPVTISATPEGIVSAAA